jgi:hypothetical protein
VEVEAKVDAVEDRPEPATVVTMVVVQVEVVVAPRQ